MDTAAHYAPLRLLRRLFLLMVILGVFGMHTLGHPESGHGHGDVVAMPAHMSGDEPRAVTVAMADVASAGPTLPDFDPASTCLAVLTSFLILLLAALRVRSRRWSSVLARTGVWVRCVPRPPPRRVALDLTRLAVLRI